MADNLKLKAAKGIVWKFIGHGGTQLIQFVSGIYIARILSPEDYGLIGMMAIFLGISQIFVDSGFRATLIQKGNEATQDHYNVVFIFNITVSSFFYLLIFIGAPYIADFYNEYRLLWVARILGINIILSSLGLIHQTILEKRLNFRTLTKIRLISTLTSVFLGIIFAIKGYGVWALVFMTISESFVRVVIIWWVNKWFPTFRFDVVIFKELFAKGIQIFLAGILRTISENIFTLIIGKFFTTSDVGFYSQGKKLQKRIGDFIATSFQSVMYPVQSLMKDDKARLKNAVRKNVTLVTLVSFPAVVGFLVISRPFIELLLTTKWLPSVYYLQILSIAGMFFILRGSVNSHVMPLGKFNILVLLSIIQSGVLILLITIGIALNLSLRILVIAKIIQEVVGFLISIYYAKKFIYYNLVEIIIDVYRPTLFSIIMGVVVYGVGLLFKQSFAVLFIQCLFGGVFYITLNYLFNRRLVEEIKPIFLNWLSRLRFKNNN